VFIEFMLRAILLKTIKSSIIKVLNMSDEMMDENVLPAGHPMQSVESVIMLAKGGNN